MRRFLRLAPDVTAGSVSALVTLSYSVSYAVLIFSGPTLEPFLARGFRAALVAAALVALVVAVKSSFPFAIAGPDSNASAILAVMAAGLTHALTEARVPVEQVANAVVLMLGLTAIAAGFIVSLLGLLRWGQLVRLIPYPVCGGFLAGSGFLLLAGAWKVLTGQSPRLEHPERPRRAVAARLGNRHRGGPHAARAHPEGPSLPAPARYLRGRDSPLLSWPLAHGDHRGRRRAPRGFS